MPERRTLFLAGRPTLMSGPRLEQLVSLVDGRGEVPFEAALVACRTRIFRAAILLLGSREEAEDVTQRAMVRALESRERFRGESGVYTWTYRILVNLCKDLYKSRSRADRWLDRRSELPLNQPSLEPTGEEILMRRERDERVRAALLRLDDRLREVLVLRHYQEMSYDEIADAVACPVGTVRSRLSAARERLRAELAPALLAQKGSGR